MSQFPRSVWDQFAEAVRSGLMALDLPGLRPTDIQIREPFDSQGSFIPGISLHWKAELDQAYSNLREKIGYGVAVTDIAESSGGRLQSVSQWSYRREVIRRWCRPKRLAGIYLPGGHQLHTTFEPHAVQVPKGANNYRVHSFVVRCWMIEPRS